MSFNVTLPSNSSFEYFPNNYSTKLHSTLRLDGNYEVGLVEMSYPQNWVYKKDGSISFKIDKKTDIFKIKFQNYDIIETLSQEIEKFCKDKNIPCGFTYGEEKLSIDIKAQVSIEFSDGLSTILGFKHSMIVINSSPENNRIIE